MKKDKMKPNKAEIIEVIQETGSNLNVKTYRVKFIDEDVRNSFSFRPGQFMMVTVFGKGEAPFGFASSPTQEYVELSIKETGRVTSAMHNLAEGDIIGIRGPYGNGFPVERAEGKNLVFIGGGIGIAPLRSLINYVLDESKRDQFGNVQMLHAFRSPEDALFKYDHAMWENSPDTVVKYTIDNPCDDWEHCVGFPHTLLASELDCELPDALFFTCGPPIMIKFITEELKKMGIEKKNIITTLEMRMSCGFGKCGRCNIGHYYVCKDGPVFTFEQLNEMPSEY